MCAKTPPKTTDWPHSHTSAGLFYFETISLYFKTISFKIKDTTHWSTLKLFSNVQSTTCVHVFVQGSGLDDHTLVLCMEKYLHQVCPHVTSNFDRYFLFTLFAEEQWHHWTSHVTKLKHLKYQRSDKCYFTSLTHIAYHLHPALYLSFYLTLLDMSESLNVQKPGSGSVVPDVFSRCELSSLSICIHVLADLLPEQLITQCSQTLNYQNHLFRD